MDDPQMLNYNNGTAKTKANSSFRRYFGTDFGLYKSCPSFRGPEVKKRKVVAAANI